MSAADAHTDIAGALAALIQDSVRAALREELPGLLAERPGEAYTDAGRHATEGQQLRWFQAYSTREASEILGMHPSDITRIPEEEMPKRKLGLARGRNAYLGIDLLCYVLGRAPVDLDAMVDALAARFERGPAVRALPGAPGKKRIL